jgi:hypothetical protein
MIDYYATQQLQIAQAQQQMRASYGHVYSAAEFAGFPQASRSAFGMAVHWLAEFAAANQDWTRQLERVAKQPIVAAIVARLGLSGVEVVLANVFVGILLDVAIAAFIKWELSSTSPGQTMLHGSMRDTLARWRQETPQYAMAG